MRGRWPIIGAAAGGLAVGFLCALAIGGVRAAGIPGVTVWSQGGLGFARAGASDLGFWLYLDPRDPSQPSGYGWMPPGLPVGLELGRFERVTVGKAPGVHTVDPVSLVWIECEPPNSSCNVPPRDFVIAMEREFRFSNCVISALVEKGDACHNQVDDDCDGWKDEADSDCQPIASASPD